MWQKFKSFILDDQIFYGFLIVLVGGVSFLLGRYSVSETYTGVGQPAVQFSTDAEVQKQVAESVVTAPAGESVIASKTGTKYHLPDCPGAKQTKSENKISFPSVAAALAAGYTPASNCPGLK